MAFRQLKRLVSQLDREHFVAASGVRSDSGQLALEQAEIRQRFLGTCRDDLLQSRDAVPGTEIARVSCVVFELLGAQAPPEIRVSASLTASNASVISLLCLTEKDDTSTVTLTFTYRSTQGVRCRDGIREIRCTPRILLRMVDWLASQRLPSPGNEMLSGGC